MKLKQIKSGLLVATSILSILLISGCASQLQAPIEGIGIEGGAEMSADNSSGIETNALAHLSSLDNHIIANFQSQIANVEQYTAAQKQVMIATLKSMSSCKTIYFRFDSIALTSDIKIFLYQVACYLLKHNQPLRLAGHTDPRGSEKYNLNLGQRRADSIRQYLLQQGVNSNQLCTVSYGKSQPVVAPSQFYGEMTKIKAQQHAYYMDRRVELDFGQTCG